MARRPETSEYAPFYDTYISKVPEAEVLPVLEAQLAEVTRVAGGVGPEQESYRYAPEKWSVRQVFGHLTDAERLFSYRAYAIARGEKQNLPGMDEKAYMACSPFDAWAVASHAEECAHLRLAGLLFFRRLDPAAWDRIGTANGSPVSVRALAYILAGHLRHTLEVLEERYGVG